MIDAADLILIQGTLSSRALTLEAASAHRNDVLTDDRMVCIYLRHFSEASGQMSLLELSSLVERLVECRCEACFDALRANGCLDKYKGRYKAWCMVRAASSHGSAASCMSVLLCTFEIIAMSAM